MERLVLDPGGKWQDVARRAAVVLRAGGVALLPAEGVYGLHALSENPVAVERLLALKPREEKKGFHRPDRGPGGASAVDRANARALSLAKSHWPRALTLVLRAGPSVPAALRNPDGTIALRCPGVPSFARPWRERVESCSAPPRTGRGAGDGRAGGISVSGRTWSWMEERSRERLRPWSPSWAIACTCSVRARFRS